MTSDPPASPVDAFDAASFRFNAQPTASAGPRRPRWQSAVLCGVVVLHACLLTRLIVEKVAPGPTPAALQVEFVTIKAAPAPPPSPMPARAAAAPLQAAPAPRLQRRPPAPLQAVEIPSATTQATRTPPAEAQLFDETGRIVVPAGAFEELQRNISDDRVFDYQVAGLAKAGKAFDRTAPLLYERSRFEDNMRPTQDMLTELLERAISASTMTVSIPVPGDPSRKIVCSVAILALGGGCGMQGGFRGAVEEDDPNTLSAEEEKQCAAWWEKITTTGQQGTWMQTRALYESNCRKPPEE